MVRVLIVDDSAFMRNALTKMLSSDPEIKIVGTAKDGIEAIEKIGSLKPDIVTMDIEMPKMDGLTALKQIMEKNPLPVIMVSSMTTEGAKITLEALDLGAADFIPKNLSELSVNIIKIRDILIEKVKQISKKGLVQRRLRAASERKPLELAKNISINITGARRIGIISIGTSSGGPKALQEVIPRFPKELPVPVVIAQHMPPAFTKPFADRLNQLSALRVKEAEEGEPLTPGVAFIAPGRGNMRVIRKRGIETVVSITEHHEEFQYVPSVDALMLSVAEYFPGRALGVILTGMGNDGLRGLTAIKRTGGRVFAQNEESCIVYGMPKAVVDAGIADKVLPIEEIAWEIINAV